MRRDPSPASLRGPDRERGRRPRRARHRPTGLVLVAAIFVALTGCDRTGSDGEIDISVPSGSERLDSASLEAGRLDSARRQWAERDRRLRRHGRAEGLHPGAGTAMDTFPAETFEEIAFGSVNRRPHLPVRKSGGGPSALHVQILLDRAAFSPGILDGRWGKNTEKAVYWFQHARGLEPTGTVDAATYEQLVAAAPVGAPVVQHTLTEDDLAGPFTSIPDDPYEKAELQCLCYESPLEKVSERFHSTPELLARLNPGIDLDDLRAGMTLWVPNVAGAGARAAPAGRVARIIISRQGFYTQALDADGNILFHFPSTLGSGYDPSPTGEYHVTSIIRDPHFHYQPSLFHEVPDEDPEAMLNPGPNSPVGVVWIGLSKPHYGIHGTAEPQTIGYTSSHGCVRLTNWDARHLAEHAPRRTPVEFR